MSTASIEITAGSGTQLHADSQTIDSNTRLNQFVNLGQPQYATYTAIASNVDIATANDHQCVVQADGSNYCRVTRITIQQTGAAAADDTIEFDVYRVTTAGTGGAAITCNEFGGGSAYSGSAFSAPSSKGTEGAKLLEFRVPVLDSEPMNPNGPFVWEPAAYERPIVFGTADTNGIAVKNIDNDDSADVTITIDFIVTTY